MINAFALSGRLLLANIKTQGVALGYLLVGLSGRPNCLMNDFWIMASDTTH
jgi:hypothetical protein